MRKLFTLGMFVLGMGLHAQTPDSVSIGAGYTGKGFYTLGTGADVVILNNTWDIAIATYGIQTASVRINGGFGVQLFRYDGGDTTAWSSLDTAGLGAGTNWLRCFDSDTSFEPSAFEYPSASHPDYGWGLYNNVTHDVVGKKVFVLKTVGGAYKKVWIKNQRAIGNTITIRMADLDNNNDTTVTFSKNVASKNYVYVDVAAAVLTDNEPANTSFDLMFARYEANLGGGMYYPVTGVMSNDGIKVAEAGAILPNDAYNNWYNLYFPNSTNMTEIGHDWKIQPPPVWTMVDSLSYFVEDLQGDVYQVWFTAFGGSTNGKYVFNVRQAGWVSVQEENNTIANFSIYPNPASEFINVAYTLDNEFTEATLNIIDLNGKFITSKILSNNQGFNQIMIDLVGLNLSSGLYIAQVGVGNNFASQRFIIK